MNRIRTAIIVLIATVAACDADEPVATVETEVLGPFTGVGAALHPDNIAPQRIRYYGTDLGFTYRHGDTLHIIFGDTMANEQGDHIGSTTERDYDDGFGTIALDEWPEPQEISTENVPLIRLGQIPGTDTMAAIDPGHRMEGFKTPVGGFSNGLHEFGLFFLGKPVACRAHSDCSGGLHCDAGLGYAIAPPQDDKDLTLACRDSSGPFCTDETIDDDGAVASGLCTDTSSSIWGESDIGRVASAAMTIRVGLRDDEDPSRYLPLHDWATTKFLNIAIRPANDGSRRLLLWGRPGFIGVGAAGRSADLYFAYVDLPEGRDTDWNLQFYTGTDAQGEPVFGPIEADAAALDLDADTDGIQPAEIHDIVNQHSMAWVEPLQKWVMLYGGGMTDLPLPLLARCGVLELFTGSDCELVVVGNGAIRMRTADDPWGPWSPPVDVLVGGDPAVPGSGQYGPGGMLRHPDCTDKRCAPHTAALDINPLEYGFLYSANIIDEWTVPTADGGAEILWNASTWDPYRVILVRTRINP